MPMFSLDDVYLISATIQVNEAFDEATESSPFQYKLSVESHVEDKPRRLLVYVRVSTLSLEDRSSYPCSFDICYKGVFQPEAEIDEILLQQFADINGPAIVFPYLREALYDLGRRAGLPPIHLPIVNFQKRAEESRLKQEKGQAEADSENLTD